MGGIFDDNHNNEWVNLLAGMEQPKFNALAALATGAKPTLPAVPSPSHPLYNLLAFSSGSLEGSAIPIPPISAIPIPPISVRRPGVPLRFNQSYIDKVVARANRRVEVLSERLDDITDGRVMPDRDDITIGSARRFHFAIMFLDICGFSGRPNWQVDEQKTMLEVMNMFMAEMLSIVHDFGGTYEKNTGDGLMAYFGEGDKDAAAVVKPAAEAALIMHYVNDQLLTPWFKNRGIPPVVFRIGIDYGPVMIASVGIHGEKSSRVAVGTAANIANKLMNRIPSGGICIGDEVRKLLPHNWASTCKQCSENSGFVYIKDNSPYTAWELNHRLSQPLV